MCRYSNAKLLVITIVTPAKNSQGVEHYVMTGQPALQIDAFAYCNLYICKTEMEMYTTLKCNLYICKTEMDLY